MARYIINSEQQKFIVDNYLKLPLKVMAKEFSVDVSVVRRYMRNNNLVVPKEIIYAFRAKKNKRSFAVEEDEYIIKNLSSTSLKKIAQALKINKGCVGKRARELGLGSIIEANISRARIKPGAIPPNKGKKQTEYMSAEVIERTKGTRFKKGNIPSNCYHEIGKVTIRNDKGDAKAHKKYKYKCVSLGKWEPLHVLEWVKVNGPIPKGYCLWFKDNNSLNCSIENLELITRAENLARNNMSDGAIASKLSRKGREVDLELKNEFLKYPEIIELKKQQIKLNRAIKHGRTSKNRG